MTSQSLTIAVELAPDATRTRESLEALASGYEEAAKALRKAADDLRRLEAPGLLDCDECGRPMEPEVLDGRASWNCSRCMCHEPVDPATAKAWIAAADDDLYDEVEHDLDLIVMAEGGTK